MSICQLFECWFWKTAFIRCMHEAAKGQEKLPEARRSEQGFVYENIVDEISSEIMCEINFYRYR